MMPAEAAMFGFNNIQGGDTFGDSIVNQFSFDVTDAGSGQVSFKFNNAGPASSTITQIYWDDMDGILSSLSLDSSKTSASGVNFTIPNNVGNLPQGNNLTPSFDENFEVARSNGQGGAANGIDSGEMLGVLFNGSFDSIIAGLNDGSLRVGMHVQRIGTASQSDAYVNAPGNPTQDVPEPLTILGSATALGIGGLLKRQQSKKNNKA
ncbi:PEP-CTERM putative exosortase interaction domain protein [Coleofasciculus chthonoplastes PCC 7420]|uniref:PEP-CTERM putative exosortase interaction domain protein n=2 Tax=Coleofasciculus chthonoplastes TaxID=64178 RepID=B4W3N6_9CYAN|nr:PEP-CTERM putative exosortase interaction domain protein [Coleofasciculus chthonoplastes PCC 7420]